MLTFSFALLVHERERDLSSCHIGELFITKWKNAGVKY